MVTKPKKYVPLTGYSDRLSVRPGEEIAFKISSQTPGKVSAFVTRSISADPNPAGTGIVEYSANELFEPKCFEGRNQEFYPGSFAKGSANKTIVLDTDFEMGAAVFPALEKASPQTIISIGDISLRVVGKNLELSIGDQVYKSGLPLTFNRWQTVAARYSSSDGKVFFSKQGTRRIADETQTNIALHNISQTSGPVVIAAQLEDGHGVHFFNGKIEQPFIDTGAQDGKITWDFSKDISSLNCAASTCRADDLSLVNFPARAMTGSTWDSSEMCWRHALDQYGAIHFHETDIYDFGWETDVEYTVPDHCPSGVYVLHVQSGEHRDSMPFFVCAPYRKPQAKLCVLVSTFTYLIYGNHARPDFTPKWYKRTSQWNGYPHNPAEYSDYGLSTYNFHPDGSGICHASHLRPLFNLRPGYLTFGSGEGSGLRHFPADSHLISWLHNKNIAFDLITDQELHDEGAAAIEGYDCIMTGSHPEYHTLQTLDALQSYRDNGGRFVYLGGNGFYWKIVPHREHNSIFEIRRAEDGIRAWAAETGEYYNAFDGSYGGLWRRNGRPPQMLAGIGFSAQGEFTGSHFKRTYHGDEYEWIFDGVSGDIIGDFGFSGGGAAGFELDRAEARLGTPENAVVLASSEGHDKSYILVPEEQLTHLTNWAGKPLGDLIRADMIYCDLPEGGALFAAGSITFCGSLPWNDFENNVSQILHNVLMHMLHQETQKSEKNNPIEATAT